VNFQEFLDFITPKQCDPEPEEEIVVEDKPIKRPKKEILVPVPLPTAASDILTLVEEDE